MLADDLHDAGLSGVEMLVEYQLPLTSKRVDALLCGTSPKIGQLVASEDVCVLRDGSERLQGDCGNARMATGKLLALKRGSPRCGAQCDVRIDNWHRTWNNKKETTVGRAPRTPFWASDARAWSRWAASRPRSTSSTTGPA